ncbi:magnesium transporter [Yoonia sp.]|uniref:magnesium transporter n=1 Tax=Yoonia sp. TaxID=2212373 RepID=UPI00391C86A3
MSYDQLGLALKEREAAPHPEELREFIAQEHPADLANYVGVWPPQDAWRVMDLLPLPRQAEVFGYLSSEFQVDMADAVARDRLARLITEMNADERADLYNELSEEQRTALLPALTQAEREDIRRLASYPHDSAGAIMTSDYAVLTGELSASEALQKLREEALDQETIYRTYVIDSDRKLLGSVRLQDLFLAPAKAKISDVMQRNTHAVTVTDDKEEVAQRVARYDLLALPVVDSDGRLVGIVTHDDAMDVMQDEATEDFHRVGASKMVRNMRDASVFMLYRARIVWLLLLVFGNIFSGAGIAYFEDTITAYVALVFFLPLLIDSGGNAGSQSATLMIRSLATGEVQMKDWSWMIGREVMVAALMGISMAAAVSVIGIFRAGPEIAIVVATSMVLIVIVGSVIGMLLPFVLTKLNLDPATASAPLVTSIADASGVLIYFAIATAFLFPTI